MRCEICRAAVGGSHSSAYAREATLECVACHLRLCDAHAGSDCPNQAGGHATRALAVGFHGDEPSPVVRCQGPNDCGFTTAAIAQCATCGAALCAIHSGFACSSRAGERHAMGVLGDFEAGGRIKGPIITVGLGLQEQEVYLAVRAKRWGEHDLPVPAHKSAGAAGIDLHANLSHMSKVYAPAPPNVLLHPGARLVVGCGFALEIPPGWEGQVRPRSGLAKDHGVVAASGTIDSDYRGEVGMNLFNLGQERVRISHGDRVAQLVISPAPRVRIELVAELSSTERGEKGFGSSGK